MDTLAGKKKMYFFFNFEAELYIYIYLPLCFKGLNNLMQTVSCRIPPDSLFTKI